MVTYYCCGCRAQYLAQPKRCPRCKGRAFSAVNDDAPTSALLDDGPFVGTPPENLDAELQAAFASSERHRLTALGQAVPSWAAEPPPAVVLEGDDAPETPRDMPEQD